IAWADGRTGATRASSLIALGLVVTLVGGALSLAGRELQGERMAPTPAAWRIGAPILVLAFVTGATAWGVYGVVLAPELAVVPRALALLIEVPGRLGPLWREPLVEVAVGGIVALFLGLALAWRTRLGEALHGASVAMRGAPPSEGLQAAAALALVTCAAMLA